MCGRLGRHTVRHRPYCLAVNPSCAGPHALGSAILVFQIGWERSGSLWLQVIGSPLAAGLLALDGVFGLKGFQWLFLVEGLPTVALGMYIHKILVDGPAKAPWLTPEEREVVIHRKAQSLQVRPCCPHACASSCCVSPCSSSHGRTPSAVRACSHA